MFVPFQVGDGPGHLEDPGEGVVRETEPVGDQFQHPVAGGVQLAVLPEVAGVHLGVAVDLGPLEPLHLEIAGALHPTADFRGAFGLGPVGQVAVADRRHLDMDVDPVQERARDVREYWRSEHTVRV